MFMGLASTWIHSTVVKYERGDLRNDLFHSTKIFSCQRKQLTLKLLRSKYTLRPMKSCPLLPTWFFTTGNLFRTRLWWSKEFTRSCWLSVFLSNGSNTRESDDLIVDPFFFKPSPLSERTHVCEWGFARCQTYLHPLIHDERWSRMKNDKILRVECIVPNTVYFVD